MIDELKSRLQKTYGETIKRINLISITERRKKGRKEEVREGKGRKNQLRDMKVKVTSSCPTLCDPMDKSMKFPRPQYWSGWPFPSPQDLPNPGMEPRSHTLQADSLLSEPPGKPGFNNSYHN